MNNVVPIPVVQSPIPPVETAGAIVSNNVKFVIKGTSVTLYETSEPINNQDTFETFDLARAGAIQAFARHKEDVLNAITQTEKDLLAMQAAQANLGNVDQVVPPLEQPVVPVTPVARANSSAVSATPIV